jgi:hypothetical protein
MFFWPQKVEKTTSKSCIPMAVGVFFLCSLGAPTAQNSPELQFRFINYFIQSSLLRSLTLSISTGGGGGEQIMPNHWLCLT